MAEDVSVIEEGDVFFFYRPRVGVRAAKGREDIQRFFIVLAPNGAKERRRYRLFVIGRKRLPEIRPGESHPEERNWALNVLTTDNPDELRGKLAALEYPTETHGERQVGAAKPAGEGRYVLLRHEDHTELAYGLELPERPGRVQEEFEIEPEASYIMAVKNPEVKTPGAPSAPEKPEYPQELMELFGDRRWIPIEDRRLLDYENAEVLLIGAHAKETEEELDITIDRERETEHSAEVLRMLHLRREEHPREPLFTGAFPPEEMPQHTKPVRLRKERAPRGRRKTRTPGGVP